HEVLALVDGDVVVGRSLPQHHKQLAVTDDGHAADDRGGRAWRGDAVGELAAGGQPGRGVDLDHMHAERAGAACGVQPEGVIDVVPGHAVGRKRVGENVVNGPGLIKLVDGAAEVLAEEVAVVGVAGQCADRADARNRGGGDVGEFAG